jgi:hypothetical protein
MKPAKITPVRAAFATLRLGPLRAVQCRCSQPIDRILVRSDPDKVSMKKKKRRGKERRNRTA